MPSRNPLRLAALAAALLPATTVLAATASAATLRTDAPCYVQGAPLQLTASGLTPLTGLVVSLDGSALRYRDGRLPSSDAAGGFASGFATPSLTGELKQQRHVLAVDDGTHTARTRFTVTRPTGAAFAPTQGDPRTLRARFSVWGFALGGVNAQTWLHWVAPDGSARRTSALGTTRGQCGSLTTAPRRVFPFDAQAGRWTLVIDTQRRYRVQTSGPRAKIPVHVRALAPRSRP